jgi:hypothetical protein
MKKKLKGVLDRLASKAGYYTPDEVKKLLELQREKCAARASYRFNMAKSSKEVFGAVINTWLVIDKPQDKE